MTSTAATYPSRSARRCRSDAQPSAVMLEVIPDAQPVLALVNAGSDVAAVRCRSVERWTTDASRRDGCEVGLLPLA